MAISEAIHAISTEDPASLGTAEPNMHDPPSLAKVAKSRGDRRNFKYLDALSADGSDTTSQRREVRVDLASNEVSPCAREVVFKKGNLSGAAGNLLRKGNVRTPSCHDLTVCVQVLHVLALDDHTIIGIPVKVGRKQVRRNMVDMGLMGGRKGRCRQNRGCAGVVQHVALRAPNIKTVIG